MKKTFLPALALLLLPLAGCHRDPQQKTLELRSRHQVELLSAQVREANLLAEGAAAAARLSARAGETDALSAAADGQEGESQAGGDPDAAPVAPEAPPGPRRVEVEFEVAVGRRGEGSLPGITLDVSQADPFQVVKKTYRPYLELPPLAAGETRRLVFRMPAEDFVDGDVFTVAVRGEVPPAERPDYRELR